MPAPRTVLTAISAAVVLAAVLTGLIIPPPSPSVRDWPDGLGDHVVGVGADGLDTTAVHTDLRAGEDAAAIAICDHARASVHSQTVHVFSGNGSMLASSSGNSSTCASAS